MSIKDLKLFKNISIPDCIAYVLFAYFLLIILTYVFSYSMDLEGMEFSFLYHLQVLKKYGTVYTNPDSFPYFICFYPPFYASFMNKFCAAMQVNILTDLHRALIWGRLISFILLFVNTWFIKKTVSLLTENKARFIHIILLLMLLYPMHFFSFRPDSFKVTFFVIFLFFYLKFHHKNNYKRHFLIALAAAAVSVFFKHDVIIYIYLLISLHWLYFRRRSSIFFTGLLSLIIFSGFFLFTKIFGTHFLKNLFFYTIQYSSEIKINFIIIAFNLCKILPLVIIAYKNISSNDKLIKFIAVCSLVFAVISNLALLRAGANLNYTYEAVILLIINLAINTSKQVQKKYPFVLLCVYLLILNNKMLYPAYFKHESNEAARMQYLQNIKTSKKVQAIIGNDIVFFTNGKYIVYNGNTNLIYGYDLHLDRFTEVYMNIPVKSTLFTNTAGKEYDELFKNGFVRYLVIDNNDVSKKQIGQYYQNFSLFTPVDNLLIYKNNVFFNNQK